MPFDTLSAAYDSLAALFRSNIVGTRSTPLPNARLDDYQDIFPQPVLSDRHSQAHMFTDVVVTPTNACIFNHLSSRVGLGSFPHYASWLLAKFYLQDETQINCPRLPRVLLDWQNLLTTPKLNVKPTASTFRIKYFEQEHTITVFFWTIQKELLVPLKLLLLAVLNPRDLRFISVMSREGGHYRSVKMDNALAHLDGYEKNMEIVNAFIRDQSPPKLSKVDARPIHVISDLVMRSASAAEATLQPN